MKFAEKCKEMYSKSAENVQKNSYSQRFGKETTKEQENITNIDTVERIMNEQMKQTQRTQQKE